VLPGTTSHSWSSPPSRPLISPSPPVPSASLRAALCWKLTRNSIYIEHRPPIEATQVRGRNIETGELAVVRITPEGVGEGKEVWQGVYNPSFDVTPAEFISQCLSDSLRREADWGCRLCGDGERRGGEEGGVEQYRCGIGLLRCKISPDRSFTIQALPHDVSAPSKRARLQISSQAVD